MALFKQQVSIANNDGLYSNLRATAEDSNRFVIRVMKTIHLRLFTTFTVAFGIYAETLAVGQKYSSYILHLRAACLPWTIAAIGTGVCCTT